MAGKNEMEVTIKPDGSLKIETGNMAGVTHKAADDFLKLVAEMMGGDGERSKLEKPHSHVHGHSHTHDDGHQH